MSWWLCGAALFATAPVACGDDESNSGRSGSSAGEAGKGGNGGTKAAGGSSSGAGGDAASGGEATGGTTTGGTASGTGGGEAGGEGGSSSDQTGLGGSGGDGEAGVGGTPELVNLVGDGWVSAERPLAPDKLFDRSGWFWLFAPPGWAQYEFIVKPASIQSYGLISGATTSTRDPKSWVLLGNDTGPDADESSDSEWTVLDARSDEGPFAERSTLYTFDVTTPGSFKFYRLKITATHGDPQVDIVELELYATPGVNAIDGVRATGFPLGNEGPDKAFDKNPDTKHYTSHTTSWLQYEFRTVTAPVEAYAIVTGNDVPERDPRNWTLLANNAGPDSDNSSDSEWTVLDTQTDQGPFPERKQRYTYPIANPGAYKYYRLKLAGSSGVAVQLSELELIGR